MLSFAPGTSESSDRYPSAATDKTTRAELELVRQLQDDFRERNDIYERIDQVMYMRHAVKVPPRYQATALEARAPLALKAVNPITAGLSVNAPSVMREPTGQYHSDYQNATLLEHFFEASWYRQQREANRRLFRIFMHHVVSHGMGVMKTVERSKRAWGGYYTYSQKLRTQLDKADGSYDEKRRSFDKQTEDYKTNEDRAPYPIATTVIHPGNFYYVKTDDGFTVNVEVSEVPYYDALERFGASFSKSYGIVPQAIGLPREEWGQVMGKRTTLKLIEVWKWDTCDYYLCGPAASSGDGMRGAAKVKTIKHGYGNSVTRSLRGPYFAADGITTSSGNLATQGISVIFGFLQLFPLYDSLMTAAGQGAFQWGWPFLGWEQEAKFPDTREMGLSPTGVNAPEIDSTLAVEPGDVLPAGMKFIDPPRLGMDLMAFLGLVRELTSLVFPDAAAGQVSGDPSGYLYAQAGYRASLEWDPIVDNVEDALGARTSFEAWLIGEKVKERVYAYGELPPRTPFSRQRNSGQIAVGPDDFKGNYRLNVRLDPKTPSNDVIATRTLAEKLRLEIITPADAIEVSGGNADEVEFGWLLYKAKHDPRVQSKILDKAIALADIKERQEMQGASMELLNALGLAPSGMTGAPTALGKMGNPEEPGQTQPLLPAPMGAAAPDFVGQGVGGGAPGTPVTPGPPMNTPPGIGP